MENNQKRVLLKLSGEQLGGENQIGIDPEVVKYIANEVKQVFENGTEIVIVVGGGNMVRGAEIAKHGIRRVTGDQMGMLSGLINAMAMTDIFEDQGITTRCLSNIFAQQVAESYSYRLAEKHIERKRVVIVAGGLGRPYFTHDTAAVNLALELSCEVMLKATKVDGVYDQDPTLNPTAQRFSHLTHQAAIENPNIKIMDKAALGLAMEHNLPIRVFDLNTSGNFAKVLAGEDIGTSISSN